MLVDAQIVANRGVRILLTAERSVFREIGIWERRHVEVRGQQLMTFSDTD